MCWIYRRRYDDEWMENGNSQIGWWVLSANFFFRRCNSRVIVKILYLLKDSQTVPWSMFYVSDVCILHFILAKFSHCLLESTCWFICTVFNAIFTLELCVIYELSSPYPIIYILSCTYVYILLTNRLLTSSYFTAVMC